MTKQILQETKIKLKKSLLNHKKKYSERIFNTESNNGDLFQKNHFRLQNSKHGTIIYLLLGIP